jgi:ubiquinone/menaquinone biosynthesis C-methylase UbiE
VALGQLAKQDGRYANTPVSARFLVAGGRDDARAAIGHTISLWSSWSTLTDAVRAGHSVLPPDAHDSPDWTVPFIAAMHRNAALRAPLLVQAVGPGVTRMLDVGGGSGACAIAFAQANPDLQVDLLDVPEVLPIARGHIERAGLERRIQLCAGDLTSDLLGQGYDLVLLSAICHMLSEAENLDLLRRARAALVPGGRLLVQDFILEPGGTAPVHAALFSINMLVGTQAGRCYDEATYSSWMEQAGLGEVRRVRLPGPSDLMIATRG